MHGRHADRRHTATLGAYSTRRSAARASSAWRDASPTAWMPTRASLVLSADGPAPLPRRPSAAVAGAAALIATPVSPRARLSTACAWSTARSWDFPAVVLSGTPACLPAGETFDLACSADTAPKRRRSGKLGRECGHRGFESRLRRGRPGGLASRRVPEQARHIHHGAHRLFCFVQQGGGLGSRRRNVASSSTRPPAAATTLTTSSIRPPRERRLELGLGNEPGCAPKASSELITKLRANATSVFALVCLSFLQGETRGMHERGAKESGGKP